MAERRATVFPLSGKNRKGGHILPPSSARVNPPPPGLFLYPPQPGGSDSTPPPAISKTDGRRETDEAAFERSRRDASKPLSKI